MKDTRALSYCNMFAIFGAIPTLLELDERAQEQVKNKNISIGFNVKNGPKCTIFFKNGKAEVREGLKGSKIRLFFSGCEKFNDLIDGKGTPIPTKGFFRLGFLLKNFTVLTDILTEYLRPAPEKLEDKEFLKKSTTLMLHVIAHAVCELGNHDKVSMFSASNMVDGDVHLSIADQVKVGVRVKDHKLTALDTVTEPCFSSMSFDSFETARDLFDGKINALVAVGLGNVRVNGMISQIDNLNRILDRVAIYLA